ncbi:hypothetical protein GE09DRAFT_1177811 [Coniochaeta sp. 2T2.1]|nr:hypothetical protein GE09DRAFT_1177811 [Coniochaeta sp. 2T2.1]
MPCLPEESDYSQWFEQRRLRFLTEPFLDDTIMDDGPPTRWSIADFRVPRLRKCPFIVDSINWERARILGLRMDRIVWCVYFGEEGPYALKLRECQNAAILQMMRASLDYVPGDQEGAGKRPVRVLANPTDWDQARANFFAFAEENRKRALASPEPKEPMEDVGNMPRFARCYGWLHFNLSEVLPRKPRRVYPYGIDVDKQRRTLRTEHNRDEFIAVMYEYVESGENNTKLVEKVARFLWLAGFSFFSTPLAKNWKNSILVGHSKIMGPHSYGWQKFYYRCRADREVLKRGLDNNVEAKGFILTD